MKKRLFWVVLVLGASYALSVIKGYSHAVFTCEKVDSVWYHMLCEGCVCYYHEDCHPYEKRWLLYY